MLPSEEWRFTWNNKNHRKKMSRVNETENHDDINLGSWFPICVIMQNIHAYNIFYLTCRLCCVWCVCVDTVDFKAGTVGMMQHVLHSHPDHGAIQPGTLWLSCQAFHPELCQQAETSALLLRLLFYFSRCSGGWVGDGHLIDVLESKTNRKGPPKSFGLSWIVVGTCDFGG